MESAVRVGSPGRSDSRRCGAIWRCATQASGSAPSHAIVAGRAYAVQRSLVGPACRDCTCDIRQFGSLAPLVGSSELPLSCGRSARAASLSHAANHSSHVDLVNEPDPRAGKRLTAVAETGGVDIELASTLFHVPCLREVNHVQVGERDGLSAMPRPSASPSRILEASAKPSSR